MRRPPADRGCEPHAPQGGILSLTKADRRFPAIGADRLVAGILTVHPGVAMAGVEEFCLENREYGREKLERVTGIEPATFCMASRRSSQLSYTRPRRGEGRF